MRNEDQPTARLQSLCESRLSERYPLALSHIAIQRLRQELEIVDRLGRAKDFLAAEKLFRYAQDEGFACRLIGAGCSTFIGYCLGLTRVEPLSHGVVFERFCPPSGQPKIPLMVQVDRAHRDEMVNLATEILGQDVVEESIDVSTMSPKATVPYLVADLLRRTKEPSFCLSRIPTMPRSVHDDRTTMDLIRSGDTEGIYMLEGEIWRYRLPQVSPGFVDDIAAMFAAQIMDIDDLRPGTMENYLSDGQSGDFPGEKWQSVRMILSDSRDLILYQEQIMLLLNDFGGIELWDGFVFCREAAKKKHAIIDEYRKRFLPKATVKLGSEEAESLFQKIVEAGPFVGCKSQVMADAMTCFQAAYMKVHYREEFEMLLKTVQDEN